MGEYKKSIKRKIVEAIKDLQVKQTKVAQLKASRKVTVGFGHLGSFLGTWVPCFGLMVYLRSYFGVSSHPSNKQNICNLLRKIPGTPKTTTVKPLVYL